MSSEKLKYGLLGEKLGHSFSPVIHYKLGISDYRLIETDGENLKNVLCDRCYGGFNITIPYKREAMKLCDEIDDEAKEIGCVNTIVREKDGRLFGYNTDINGFIYMARRADINFNGRKTLILGSGGTSLTVQKAARRLGASRITVISRSGEVTYERLRDYADSEIIVNTTPVGMYPDNLESLVRVGDFPNCTGVVDVIYNPRRTVILMDAERLGIPCTDGLPMLVYQAKRAQELFLRKSIPDSEAERVIRELRAESGNIVLIGMPGSGKSTVARLIADRTGKKLVDIDTEIEKTAGKTIPAIFEGDGENVFREFEREETAKAGKLTGMVIAAGGGVVKDMRNYASLRQNGRIYCICREIDKLDIKGRPLSKSKETLYSLQREREPLYRLFADVFVDNNAEPEVAAERILEDYYENISD
ncbi:MAG: shikimate kinase [Clostridiales bacterium]|nr:shikimate kinase [Clostridiales bacterium]